MVPARKGIIMGKISIHDSWKNEPEKFDSMVDFLNWFDGTKSIVDTLLTAQKDWEQRISNFKDFPSIRKGACLEIGFGGGRLMVQAGRTFARATGIDIHDAFDMTNRFLQNQGIHNYQLLHKDEMIYLKDNSIDFIYSFIVFQHFESFDEVNFYLEQIKRLLTDGGMAHIFFGKNKANGINN